MLAPLRSFNIKVLGWFWLTFLITLTSVAIPAWLMSEFSRFTDLRPQEKKLLSIQVHRIQQALLTIDNDPRLLDPRERDMDTHSPFQWLLVDDQQRPVLSSVPMRQSLLDILATEDVWYFLQSDTPQELSLERYSLIGPVSLLSPSGDVSPQGLKLVMWRPDRNTWFSAIRKVPNWLIILQFGLISVLMSWLLVRSIANPLNRLKGAFHKVGNGQLNYRILDDMQSQPLNQRWGNDEFARLFEQFDLMAEKIQALIQNQKRQSADISHELRTPLTRLQMTLALARKKCQDDNLLPLLERAEKENEQLNQHIQTLTDLTTLESRAIQIGRQTFTLESLLEELCADAEFEASSHQLQWHQALSPHIELTLYEEPALTAIENIVRNAFKYAQSQVSLTTQVMNDDVEIVITDDGPGVDESELRHLTEAFYRTDKARQSHSGGLGLGLAIAAEAMRLNQGTIRFANLSPHGLQVVLGFPLRGK